VPGEVAAAAKAGHIAHELAVRDLELIKAFDLGTGLRHKVRPDDLGEVPFGSGAALK
jgi:hypothetical protein